MSGIWFVTVPEASTNYVLNPSAEMADNYGGLFVGSPSTSISPSGSSSPSSSASISPSGSTSPSSSISGSPSSSASISPSASSSRSPSASASGSASPSPSPSFGIAGVSRVTTYARFGVRCYLITTPKPYDGMWLGLSALSNAAHYVSLYLYDSGASTPEVSLNGRAFYAMSVIGGRDGGWVRYGVAISATDASGSTRLDVRMPTESDFYIDAVQVEANSYGTTYIDGDRGPLYKWSGLRHGSTSTRSAQERGGGRERNLLDDYSIEVVEGTKRIGTPPVLHNLQSQSLLPGAGYQGVKVLPREIEFQLHYTAETWAGFHGKRNDVIDLFKPDLVRGSQPVTIGYAGPGTDKKVYAQFYYNGGMEFGDFLAYDESPALRLLAPDPFFYADDQQTAALDYQDSLTAAYGLRRVNGQWQTLGSGFNNIVNAVAVDTQRGRVYFGGDFTHANGVLVNGVCYWDGSNFYSMGGGVTGGVAALAIAPSGDVWVGGQFTAAGGSTSDSLARWNVSTRTWTQFTNGTPGDIFYALAVTPSNVLYAGGDFQNWNGSANADNIFSYDGSTFSALGTGTNGPVRGLASSADGSRIYVVGNFTTGDGVTLSRIGYWNGTTFVAMGSAATVTQYAVAVAPNGDVYAGGSGNIITGVAGVGKWNGSSWQALGSGIASGTVYHIRPLSNGRILVSGDLVISGLSLADDIALWNGSSWSAIDADLPGSAVVFGSGEWQGDLFAGFSTTGTATVSGLATVTNSGSTVAYPRLSVLNENSSGSCTLQWLENQSSDHVMYFNLAVQAGETVTLDLGRSQKRLTSDWRGTITDNPLPNSAVVNWLLLPGANTIAAFISGTITTVTALLHWQPRYWSADGEA